MNIFTAKPYGKTNPCRAWICAIALMGVGAGCGPSEFAIEPERPEKGEEFFEITPAPLTEAERRAALQTYAGLKSQIELADLQSRYREPKSKFGEDAVLAESVLALESQIMSPTREDFDAFADLLKDPHAGLFRLFACDQQQGNPHAFAFINGGGCYYSFHARTNVYGFGSDVRYKTFGGGKSPGFYIGFAGLNFGFFAELGHEDIRTIDASDPLVQAVLDYKSPHGKPYEGWWAAAEQFPVKRNFHGKFTTGSKRSRSPAAFAAEAPAELNVAYAVRSMVTDRYDVAALFQVVRKDAVDGSLIVAFKVLKEYPVPLMAGRSRNDDGLDGSRPIGD